jgi:hypothetical protein
VRCGLHRFAGDLWCRIARCETIAVKKSSPGREILLVRTYVRPDTAAASKGVG